MTKSFLPSAFQTSDEVAAALADGRPVVALESTIISHGLPRPRNLEAAIEFETILRDAGVTPATIAVLDGIPRIGLDAEGVRRIAEEDLTKASVRDLPIIAARGASGATTVAATAHLAGLAGIRVFATGGLGGVHRGASETFDESADLSTLAVTPVAVVSAGVKSVLDIAATLERLETLSVPVVGFGTNVFPSFWLRESAFTLDWSVDTADGDRRDPQGTGCRGLPLRHGRREPHPGRAGMGHRRARPRARRGVRPGGCGRSPRQGRDPVPPAQDRRALGRQEPRGEPRPRQEQRARRGRDRNGLRGREARLMPDGRAPRFLVVGDVIDDVLVVLDQPIRPDTDTPASIRQVPGGSAANTAAWLAALGQHVAFAGAVGAEDVVRVAASLPGVEARLVATPEPTGSIVVLVQGEHRSMLTSRGANAELDLSAIDLDGFDVLHLTGHPLLQSSDGGAAFTALIARAKAAGLVVSLDPGSAGFLADFGAGRFLAAVAGVDVLLPSLDEATLLTDAALHGATALNGAPLHDAMVLLLPFETVVLKLGRHGAYVKARDGDEFLLQDVPAARTTIVDPTGAGDAFAAGFLAAWMVDRDAVAAARAASAVAARAVASAGGRP